MDEQRSNSFRTTGLIWAVLVPAFLMVKAYALAPLWIWLSGILWLVLALVAALALDGPQSRQYLAGTLRTSHYTQVYLYVARRLNDVIWRRVGRLHKLPDGTDALPSATTPTWPLLRAALTWRLADRALLIAVAYPMVALVVPWLAGGDAVLGAEVVVFPVTEFWPERAAALFILTILLVGLIVLLLWESVVDNALKILETRSTIPVWMRLLLRIRWIIQIVPLAFVLGVVVIGIAFLWDKTWLAFSVGLTVGILYHLSGPSAVLNSILIALMLAIGFQRTIGIPLLLAATSSLVVEHIWPRSWKFSTFSILIASWVSVSIATVLFVDLAMLRTDQKALFLFLAVLPLINGLYDALSYAMTLALSRKGLSTRLAPLYGLADLALGAALFLALGATMVAAIAALNAIGTTPLYDLEALFAGLRANPRDYWWLYLILFSTLAPTALHLAVAALAVQGWVLFQRPRRKVANWIAAAPTNQAAAVCAFLAQATIWWVPLIALAGLGWALWQISGTAFGTAGLLYLNWLEWLARSIDAI